MDDRLKERLRRLADRYETKEFLASDPAQFMHRYAEPAAQERAAFVSAALSYGNRKQFLPRIDALLATYMQGEITVPDNDECFYRLHTNKMVRRFLTTLDSVYARYGSMKTLVETNGVHTARGALTLITDYFARHNASSLVPRNTASPCKRLCMFLRWMVRDLSAVDLGLWSGTIDKSTLIIPLDTHVLQEARKTGLITSRSATLATAVRLTELMKEVFPGDPARADFALFGLGTDAGRETGKQTSPSAKCC